MEEVIMAKQNGVVKNGTIPLSNGMIPLNGAGYSTTMSPEVKIRDLEELMLDIDSLICGKRVELRQLEQRHDEIKTAIETLGHQLHDSR